MKISKVLARGIASNYKPPTVEWDSLREFVNAETSGELDTLRLDMLTDWVMEILLIGVATLPDRITVQS